MGHGIPIEFLPVWPVLVPPYRRNVTTVTLDGIRRRQI